MAPRTSPICTVMSWSRRGRQRKGQNTVAWSYSRPISSRDIQEPPPSQRCPSCNLEPCHHMLTALLFPQAPALSWRACQLHYFPNPSLHYFLYPIIIIFLMPVFRQHTWKAGLWWLPSAGCPGVRCAVFQPPMHKGLCV